MMSYDELATAIAEGRVSHTRIGTGCWKSQVWVYGRSAESPTGVTLLGAVLDNAEFAPLLKRALSPLSPTER
jgi:hypothetical protein